jgi:hypothetical protein
MGEVILHSSSWEKGGEPARQKHLEAVIEGAGLEVDKTELPEPPAELNENLTPQHVTAYLAQIEEAKKMHGDWDELRASLQKNDIEIGKAAQAAILKLKNGAEVSYHLLRNREEAERLGKMKANEAVKEVGRIASKLTNEARRNVRPSDNASFEEVLAAGPYWGRSRDIRRALRRRR